MHRLYLAFVRGVAANWLAKSGVALTTGSVIVSLGYAVLSSSGALRNPYFDLLAFMVLPALFVTGLLLVAIGWWRFKRHCARLGLSQQEVLRQRFGTTIVGRRAWGSPLLWVISALTAANVALLGGASAKMKSFMDAPEFCGTTCHVMRPEWTVYQSSPHSAVACVQCHVGEGTEALIASKLRGLGQMYEHALGLYHRPIPTPVRTLRSARETCGRCHGDQKDYGERIRVRETFALDAAVTRRFDTVGLKVGSATGERGGIHWHAAESVTVRYASADDARRRVVWVESVDKAGRSRRFTRRGSPPPVASEMSPRVMDCTDCHNRPAHQFDDAEQAIDERLADGRLDRRLPWLKAKALSALVTPYSSRQQARARIRARLEGFYAANYPRVAVEANEALEAAVEELTRLWERNVHPEMNVQFGDYPSLLGHRGAEQGCFRCHNRELVDAQGVAIGHQCTLCHSLLADDSPSPFALAAGQQSARAGE